MSDKKSPEPFFIKRGAPPEIFAGGQTIREWTHKTVGEARFAGAKHVRISWTDELTTPTYALVEGWYEKPEDEGPPRFDDPAVVKAMTVSGSANDH